MINFFNLDFINGAVKGEKKRLERELFSIEINRVSRTSKNSSFQKFLLSSCELNILKLQVCQLPNIEMTN